ncbi:MAG: hypothetical protein H6737_23595 [Alphaproteobacteria bacterium]|nr:hypothetical protein [Alphaproteobacteria bacterium]
MIGGATVGVAEHGNSVELVTVAADGALIDRRRVDLTHDLPTHPYHHEGAWAVGRYLDSPWARPIALPEAIALIERVHAAAAEGAEACLAALPASVGVIAIRECPELPPTVEGRLHDNRAQTQADSVMYRMALANAATARGWRVSWYDRDRVRAEAAASLDGGDLDAVLRAMGREAGPPWQARHKLAATAALAARRS